MTRGGSRRGTRLHVTMCLAALAPGCTAGAHDVSHSPAENDASAIPSEGAPAVDGSWGETDSPPSSQVADRGSDASATDPPVTSSVNTISSDSGPRFSHGSRSLVSHHGFLVVVFDDTDEDVSRHASGWSRSTNAGGSFTDEGSMPGPAASGVDDIGYPVVARDATIGAAYVVADGRTHGTATYGALAFFVSEDDGETFHPAINAADPNLMPGDYVDVPSIAVDNTAGFWQGLVYVAYVDVVGGSSPVKLRLSTFDSHSFAVTEVVSPAPGDEAALPSIGVAPDGSVWIVYYSKVGSQASIAAIQSTDQGAHFFPPVTVAMLRTPVVAGTLYGNLGLLGTTPSGASAPVDVYPSPQLAIHPATGALYVAYVDATEDDKANIYLVHSEDSGSTWSAPVRVNDDATHRDQFLPAIAVSADGSRLGIAFYDRRNDSANRLADRYGVTVAIEDKAITLGSNFRISALPFPILVESDPLA